MPTPPRSSVLPKITTEGSLGTGAGRSRPCTSRRLTRRTLRVAAQAGVLSAVTALSAVGAGPLASHPAAHAATSGSGVNDVSAYGDAPRAGAAGTSLAPSVVGMAPTATGKGYWTAATDGTVASFGDAPALGSVGSPLAAAIVGIAATPSGHGYWLVASDGGIFSFGDARFLGSTGAVHLNRPIAGMASTPSGNGYWLVASDGGIFSFGDATFYGSTGAMTLAKPIAGMASTISGKGYWLVASDGGIFTFGDAVFYGSEGGKYLNAPVVGMTAARNGKGYWLATSNGGVYPFGSAPFQGSLATDPGTAPAVAVASTPSSGGYWLATGRSDRRALGTFVATCYSDNGTTASGAQTGPQTVAVDPSVIPLGTHLWIDGVGERIAQDTGGDIRGNRIDLWNGSYDYCVQYGRQDVQVYIEQ